MRRAGLVLGVWLLAAGVARAQESGPPPEVVDLALAGDLEPGAAGVTLSAVARTPGVPVVLETVRGTVLRPVARVTVTSEAATPLVRVALSVTWTPPGAPPRRRLLTVPVTLAPGERARLAIGETAVAQGLAGQAGVVEVALAGAVSADGTVWTHSPGPAWATDQAILACGDGAWAAQPKGTDAPDATTGAIVRCASDGRWLRLDAEGAR